MKKKYIVVAALLMICMSISLYMSAYGADRDEAWRNMIRPEQEGVYTNVEIIGYKSYTGEHKDLFLKERDKIAVISPSSTPTRKRVDFVIKGLEKWGYIPVEGNYASVEERSLQDCIDDFVWALEDPEIKGIFCVRGGYGAIEVMDEIPKELIVKNPKPIIGYSDITAFHSAWIRSGFPSLHASMSGAFVKMPENCVEAQQRMMQGQIPEYKCESDSYCKAGKAKGILIGGNLPTFVACLGTDYDTTQMEEPYILFFEGVREELPQIHRYLTVLKHMGVLDRAQGIIFGEWIDNKEDTGNYDGDSRGGEFISVEDMIDRQFAQGLDIPIAYGFPAGHGDINYPLLLGEEMELNVSEDSFTIIYQ